MASNKRLIAAGATTAAFDPLQNFETVTYTGNGGTQKITGYIRKGAAFNGSSSSIDLGSNLGLANNSFSISFWLNANSQSSDHYFIGDTGTWGSNSLHIGPLDSTTDKLRFSFGSGSNVDSATSVSYGTWQHWVCDYNATTNSIKIYLNGSLDNSDTTTTDYVNTTNIQLGAIALSGYNGNGRLDQVRFFNKSLSSSEVTTLYNETYASSTKSTTDIFGDGSGVALYELDEDASDTGLYGSGAIDAGQSAVFNGSSSIITTPQGTAPYGSNSRTFSLWINTTNTSSNQTLIHYGNANPPNSDFFVWRLNGSGSSTIEFSDFVGTYSESATSIFDGNWHHLAFVYNGSTVQYYVDGSPLGSGSSFSLTTANTTMGIGDYNSAAGVVFDGKIDQVRIYSSALSSTDIANLCAESNVPTANLVAHYKLDGDATDEQLSYDGAASNVTYTDPAEFPSYDGTPTNVNFLGMAFQPDLVWIKSRSASGSHILTDSVRGDGKEIYSDLTNQEGTVNRIALDSNGFTVTATNYPNQSGSTFVSWCWKAGGAAVSNTDGTITSQVSANQAAGFSIVKYTSNGSYTSSDTIGHGLSQPPELVIWKPYETTTSDWFVQYELVDGSVDYLILNEPDAKRDSASTYLFQSNVLVNFAGANGQDTIAYCFHSVDGYQKVGSYSGSSSTITETVGFQPRFLLVKRAIGGVGTWYLFDGVRNPSNPRLNFLRAESSNAETVGTIDVNFNSDNFQIASGATGLNALGNTYIYLAIA